MYLRSYHAIAEGTKLRDSPGTLENQEIEPLKDSVNVPSDQRATILTGGATLLPRHGQESKHRNIQSDKFSGTHQTWHKAVHFRSCHVIAEGKN